MKRIRSLWKALKMAGEGFIEDNAFKLSASLSYYTIYALGPLFVIIISLAGIFFGNDAVEGRLYAQLNGLVGSQAALQIQDIIGNIQESKLGTVGAIVGGIVLFIGATGVFTEMQDSINFIWSVKAKPKKGWLKFLSNRLLSFSLILGMGFILLVSLLANTLLNLLSEKLMRLLPNYTVQLFNMINSVIIVIVICTLFTFIFKVLPDAIISWKDALIGATFTTMLFLLGKFLINYYIGTSNLGLTYGAAASVIIILTWVYYSALILYFGAEFTKMYALQSGSGIKPKDTAVFIIKREAKEIPNIQE
ncbi:MAG TPA: YihY/virulence factor BrkB family protein [Flavisolibacter sp.]|jgi:membrane protein|nr:YihY/virulence factor BrkB family protein [Flavisolibacter sp.]